MQPLCARPPPMRDAQGNPNTGQMLVFVPPHPLIKHWLAISRNEVRKLRRESGRSREIA